MHSFPQHMLPVGLAGRIAASTLGHIRQVYPHHQSHWLNGPEDACTPDRLHPLFHGSFDWHSCVHGWWHLMRLARLFPDMEEAVRIRALADEMISADKVAGEIAYFERPGTSAFERPYGWAWLMMLHRESRCFPDHGWAATLEPLARLIAARWKAYLGRLRWPVRHGVHSNTAFALILSHAWALECDPALAACIAETARVWFCADRACADQEPSGEDFLSPTLTAAVLMARTLPAGEWAAWSQSYWRGEEAPAVLLHPVKVTDRSDPRIAHLDGLNLSRAWCWSVIAPDERERIDAHLAASLPHLTTHYMGEHWLSTFALLALDGLDSRADSRS